MTLRQIVYCFLGFVFLLLGIAGVVLPVLPHTPFFLLSVACYAKGSKRIHSFLLSNKYIGPAVKDWQQHKRIRKRAKIAAVIWVTLSISYSVYMVEKALLKAMLITIGILVVSFILTRKS